MGHGRVLTMLSVATVVVSEMLMVLVGLIDVEDMVDVDVYATGTVPLGFGEVVTDSRR